jgi:mono/diheme cytochrome c family protein
MNLKPTLILLTAFFTVSLHAAPPVEEGKAIFQARCAACHNISKTMTGPALAGVDQRRSMEWIINFVHSSQSVIKGGDKDAVALFHQFNKIQMPDHKDLSGAQIKNVVEYIKAEATTAKEATTLRKKTQPSTAYLPVIFKNYGFLLSFFALLALLVGVIMFHIKVNNYKQIYFGQKQ